MKGKTDNDNRMLAVISAMLQSGKYRFANEILEIIGISHNQYSQINRGLQSFTAAHIWKLCKATGASADYIFGFSNQMFRMNGNSDPMDRLKEAVHAVEALISRSNITSNKKNSTQKKIIGKPMIKASTTKK